MAPASFPSAAATIGTSGRTSAPSRSRRTRRGAARGAVLPLRSPLLRSRRSGSRTFHETRHPLTEPSAHLGEERGRGNVAVACRLAHDLTGHAAGIAADEAPDRAPRGPRPPCGHRPARSPGRSPPAPSSRGSRTRIRPVRLDDHVPDLARETVRPSHEPAALTSPATDPRPHADEQESSTPREAPRTVRPTRPPSRRCPRSRAGERGGDCASSGRSRQTRLGVVRGRPCDVDETRHADPDRDDVVIDHRRDRRLDRRARHPDRTPGGARVAFDRPLGGHPEGGDLRAADVDADRLRSLTRCRYA